MKKVQINKEILERILEDIQQKPLRSYIYPEIIEQRYNLKQNEVLKLLVVLEKESVVKQVYKLFCPKCQDFGSEVFDSINELEEQDVCEYCGKELMEDGNPYKYVVVYFRVIKNE